MNEKIQIEPLTIYSDFAPILAYWAFTQWYLKRNISFAIKVKDYQARARSENIPCSFVALVDGLPVGMVSIKNNDLWHRKDLNPWLASL